MSLRYGPSVLALLATLSFAITWSPMCWADTVPPTTDDNTRARALFRKGVDAFRSGKNEEAAQALSDAWAIRETYDVAGALAQAEIALKRYRAAAEHLDFCVAHFSPAETEQSLQQVKAALSEVKTHVATVLISVDSAGVEVHVDERTLGVSPLGLPTFVDPGVHTLQAVVTGSAPVTQVVNVQAGHEYPVRFRVLSKATTMVKAPTSERSLAAGKRSMVPVIIGAAVFVAGVGSAIAFELAASSQGDTAHSFRERAGSTGCADGSASARDCSAQRDALDSKKHDRNWAAGSLVLAGVAAVATPVYFFWPRSRGARGEDSERGLAVRVAGSAAGANVSFSGQF